MDLPGTHQQRHREVAFRTGHPRAEISAASDLLNGAYELTMKQGSGWTRDTQQRQLNMPGEVYTRGKDLRVG